MRIARVLLVIVAVVCLGVAVSYPIRYRQAQEKNDTDMESLARMRQQSRESQAGAGQELPKFPELPGDSGDGAESAEPAAVGDAGEAADSDVRMSEADLPAEAPARDDAVGADGGTAPESPSEQAGDSGKTSPERQPGETGGSGAASSSQSEESAGSGQEAPEGRTDGGAANAPAAQGENPGDASGSDEAVTPVPAPTPTPRPTPTPEPTLDPNFWDLTQYYAPTPSPTPRPKKVRGPTVAPTPTPDRSIRKGPLPYTLKEKVELDEAAILPELKEIYALNHDLVGWITIPDTVIDYPVVQGEDGEYYLTHDFYGEENINGQIILDKLCDPYTPSYNLVVSGHHMKNGSMFGGLPQYRTKSYWEKHRFLELDTLMERKIYVIFACFYSADYDEDETGFRYNAILDYKIDAEQWLDEVLDNQLYDTGIEREFGDEFITLTTCDRARHRNGRFVVVGRKIREGETFE